MSDDEFTLKGFEDKKVYASEEYLDRNNKVKERIVVAYELSPAEAVRIHSDRCVLRFVGEDRNCWRGELVRRYKIIGVR